MSSKLTTLSGWNIAILAGEKEAPECSERLSGRENQRTKTHNILRTQACKSDVRHHLRLRTESQSNSRFENEIRGMGREAFDLL
jgi:hypothetical protein